MVDNGHYVGLNTEKGGKLMTGRLYQDDGVSRREFMVAAGTAAIVSGAVAATGTPAAAAPANEICRMDAVTLAEKIRTKRDPTH